MRCVNASKTRIFGVKTARAGTPTLLLREMCIIEETGDGKITDQGDCAMRWWMIVLLPVIPTQSLPSNAVVGGGNRSCFVKSNNPNPTKQEQ